MSARTGRHGFRVTSAFMHRIVVVFAILALSFAPAGLAHAQLGGPNVPTPLQEPPPPPPVDNDPGDEGLSTVQQLLIFVGAGLVVAVIGFVIVRDARKAAPPDPRPGKSAKSGGAAGGSSPTAKARAKAKGGAPATVAATDNSASVARARERQQAKRAKTKAKAVREQRKRNRPH